MSFTNYPMDEQLCRVLSVSHSNSIHEVDNMTNDLNLVWWKLIFKVVLRGSISYNTEFQRPLQYKLELRHLPDNYTFMVLEDAMYSVQVNIKLSFCIRGLTRFWLRFLNSGVWGEAGEEADPLHHQALHPLTAPGPHNVFSFSTMHNVYIVQFFFLSTERAGTYRPTWRLSYYWTYICPNALGRKEQWEN